MDKYNQYALSTIKYKVFMPEGKLINEVVGITEAIIIKQDHNYTIDQYYLAFEANNISSIVFDEKTYDKPDINPLIDSSQPYIFVPVVYSKKIDNLIVELQDGILDPIMVSVQYEDTNKTIYDSECQKAINKKINLSIMTGLNLINVYWDNVSKKVDHIVFNLYGYGDRLVCSSVEKDISFKSISGLAFGGYYKCEVIEYDKADQILATQSCKFELMNPFKK